MKYENQHDKVEVLAKNSEEYISITYGNIYRKLVFLDSYRFLQKGLADIAKSLNPEDFNITGKYFNVTSETPSEQTRSLTQSEKIIRKQSEAWPSTQFSLIRQKGVLSI